MSDERVPVPPEGAAYDSARYASPDPAPAGTGAFGAHSNSYDSARYGSRAQGADYAAQARAGAGEGSAGGAYRAPDSAFEPGSGNPAATAPQPQYTPPSGYGSQPGGAQAGKAAKPKKAKRGLGVAGAFFSGLVGAAAALALVVGLWSYTPVFDGLKGSPGAAGTISIEQAEDGGGATTAEAVAAKCIDSVVTIYVYTDTASSWSQLFGGSSGSSKTPSALGSGVIIANEGDEYFVLTNYHVVENISKATVKVGDQEYSATPVGYDEKTDLAVVKIKASGLTVAEWGDSASLKVGEWAGVIGAPHGYEQSLTVGVISALYRNDTVSGTTGATTYTDMIQTDAAINPGNSGGGLFDANGKLIGINTFITSTSGSSASLGFAIPQKTAQEVADEIISGKEVQHAFLGVSMSAGTAGDGVEVAAVYKGTAAEEAGLRTGDVILKIDGKKVGKASDVTEAVMSKSVGDEITLTVKRGDEELELTATLKADDEVSGYAEGGEPAGQGGNGNSGSGDGDDGEGGDEGGSGGWYGYDLEDLFGGNPFSWDFDYGDSGSGNNGGGDEDSGGSDGSFWD